MRGEVRFDRGSRALYATDGSNYRQVPIGVVLPRDEDDVVAAMACAASTARRCCRAAAARASRASAATSPSCSTSRSTCTAIVELDRGGKRARVEPGLVLDTLRDAAERAPPDVRARSVHAQPLHARRHDRQQLVRRALGDGRQGGRQRRVARDPHLRRPADAGRRHDRTPNSKRSSAAGGRRGRSTRGLKRLRDKYADLIRAALSEHSAPRVRLQPRRTAARKRLQRGARARRHRGHLRHGARSDGAAGSQPAGANARSSSAIPTSTARPITSPRSSRSSRSASKAWTTG